MKKFQEWENISPKNTSLLNKVRTKVHSIIPDADIILYGSRARAKADWESDWDFLILLDQKPNRQIVAELRDQLYELELENDIVLSSIVRSRNEWNSDLYSILPFKKAVERDGVVL
jgi:predicted nucleotidyltransferase